MVLVPGTRLGPYEIRGPLGAGGMGEVYRARDSRLGRDVAIKVLPPGLAATPEIRARFEREARTISSLNHPNICTLHDVGHEGDTYYLVMELVDGETLKERIARGPLPASEVLRVGTQIADALDKAHRAGIVHRDLKPGNIMLAKSGAKLLDFGLALATGRDATPAGQTNSATVSRLTAEGTIVGTFLYMAPEQLEGKEADARTDIWALGCVLYEMITGRRPFQGKTQASLIGAIMTSEPAPLPQVRPLPPPGLERALKQCLAKDPDERIQTAHDLTLQLRWITEGGLQAELPTSVTWWRRGRERLAWGTAALAAAAALAAVVGPRILHPPVASQAGRRVLHASLVFPPDLEMFEDWWPTPNGRGLLLRGRRRGPSSADQQAAQSQIYVRTLDGDSLVLLRGTQGAERFHVSPDSRSVVFLAPASDRSPDKRWLRAPIDGSAPPTTLTDNDDRWSSLAWLHSGDLLFSTAGGKQYVRLPIGGRAALPAPEPFSTTDSVGTSSDFCLALPGDRGVLLSTTRYEGPALRLDVGVLDLKSGRAKTVLHDAGHPRYASTGHLLFTRGDALFAVPFDLGSLEVRGEPIFILDGLLVRPGQLHSDLFEISDDGTLFCRPGRMAGTDRRIVIVDLSGKVTEWSSERARIELRTPIAPDGRHIAFSVRSSKGVYEIWVSERGRGTSQRVVSVPGVNCGRPIWSPDGRWLAYLQRGGRETDGIYIADPQGRTVPRRIFASAPEPPFSLPTSWSPDGSRILAYTGETNALMLDIPASPVSASTQTPRPFLGQRRGPCDGRFSPDGHLVSFVSNETGQLEAYICAYGMDGAVSPSLQVSQGGGSTRWGPDGSLFYMDRGRGRIMRVNVASRPTLSVSEPIVAWNADSLRLAGASFEILPDGKLLAVQSAPWEDLRQVDVISNFFETMALRIAAARKE